MANLTRIRKRITIALIVLGLIDMVALTYLLLPSREDLTKQRQALQEAEKEIHRLNHTAVPLRNVQGKLRAADSDINKFYKDRLASRYSVVLDELGKVAAKENVSIGAVQYKPSDTVIPELMLLEMQADFHAPYANLAKFINGLERDKTFFIIDSVSLAGAPPGPHGNEERLNIKFETYLRHESE